MQRLVPTARIGAVAYRDRDDGQRRDGARARARGSSSGGATSPSTGRRSQAFLDGIVAEGGGDWEEAVKDGVETAMKQLKWRADAKKVIIIVGSSPPHEKDLAGAAAADRTSGGPRTVVVDAIDVSWPLHVEHERKLHRWLYGEELKEPSPLPEFYKELQASFTRHREAGRGRDVALERSDRAGAATSSC